MVDWHAKTIKTYDDSAQSLAEYFKSSGARVFDIENALKLAGKLGSKDTRAVEVGCGDGRDGEEIIKRVGFYEGFDPSQGLLNIASKRLPKESLVRADALSYQFPENLDVIYAFASLLHVPIEDLKTVMKRASSALKRGGIFYISLKERQEYGSGIKRDSHGERMFYFYNTDIIKEIAPESLNSVYEGHQQRGPQEWFTIALRKD